MNSLPSSSTPIGHLLLSEPSSVARAQSWCKFCGINANTLSSWDDLTPLVSTHKRGFVAQDLSRAHESDFTLIRRLEELSSPLPVLLIARNRGVAGYRAALDAGAYDVMSVGASYLIYTRVLEGVLAENHRLMSLYTCRENAWSSMRRLTPNELRIAKLIAKGDTLAKIAASERFSRQAASKYRSRIFEKLGVDSAVGVYKSLHLCKTAKLREGKLAYPAAG
ncbi:MAG: hypothetical protein Aurels2KO_54770 [Aureliella sp.]